MSDEESSEMFDEEMKQVDQELDEIDSDNLNEDEFNKDVGGELDLPSEEGDEDIEDEDADMASESDEDMDAYCRDIGVDPSLLKEDSKKQKKFDMNLGAEEVVIKEKKVSARAQVVDNMMEAVRTAVANQDSSKSAEAQQKGTL